ncbi:O-acetyl-ADP-ribose deacetylase (regulator of RNase III), contains Macro domain [Mariniphaga anaerophila]|uniref:O-acetyl-ADP-ribose deacetylase (Regulator of RNase III), contains Macro domain n=1 Tax=Mariniphaga anaerophila TaxID=1484053 RepID=A0A1M4TAJ9_9BACT|nr:macro domain-containing protein [Mariniphaga anaerophila]SHE41526.1 O-acetyl-ADP-ribose deacetylase (regulator of RNase III), contains Macro domain [Mariniphaga anaerophila]
MNSEKKLAGKVTLEAVCGDIASQHGIDAVVNAANAQLMPGGGVAGAIHRAAGPGLAEECRSMAPIEPGQAVISGAHHLPNSFVIHCLGPVYGKDKPESRLLADCYRNALLLAEKNKITSVAFPAISAGIFGYPFEEAAEVSLHTIFKIVPDLKYVRHIRFVLFGVENFKKYAAKLREIE